MNASARNLLIAAGSLWGLVMAVIPAEVGFRGPMTLSPFLILAFLAAALSAAAGTLFAGWMVSGKRRGAEKEGLWRRLLAALSIWLAITVTMSGFSVATPGEFLRLVRYPEVFLQGWIVGRAVLAYSLVLVLMLPPLTGSFIYWLVRGEEAQTA